MSISINNEQKLNDIIFANRNKAYGAYALRSDYGVTILKSLSFMLFGVGTILSIAFYASNHNQPNQNIQENLILHDTVLIIPFSSQEEEMEEEAAPEEEQPARSSEKQGQTESTTIVESDSLVELTDTSSAVAATHTTTNFTGEERPGGDLAGDKNKPGKGSGNPLGTDTVVDIEELYRIDKEPEFEGGLKALYRFVSDHLKYPEVASAGGKEGTVFVKFVVDETGKVGSLRVLHPAGYGMDEEALRVVSMIPRFKSPAKIKGKAVKVYYQLPIRFRFGH
jgi:protein TonB